MKKIDIESPELIFITYTVIYITLALFVWKCDYKFFDLYI